MMNLDKKEENTPRKCNIEEVLKLIVGCNNLIFKDKFNILIQMRAISKKCREVSEKLLKRLDPNFEKKMEEIINHPFFRIFKAVNRVPFRLKSHPVSMEKIHSFFEKGEKIIQESLRYNSYRTIFLNLLRIKLLQPPSTIKCDQCANLMYELDEKNIYVCVNDKCIRECYKNNWNTEAIINKYFYCIFKNMLEMKMSKKLESSVDNVEKKHILGQCFYFLFEENKRCCYDYWKYCHCEIDENVVNYFETKFKKNYLTNGYETNSGELPFFWNDYDKKKFFQEQNKYLCKKFNEFCF